MLNNFQLYLSPIDAQRFKAIVTKSSVGEGEAASSLPFFDREQDWRMTVLRALEIAAFNSQYFTAVGELDWMVKYSILNQNQEAFETNYLAKIGQELYKALFPSNSKVEKLLNSALRQAEEKRQQLHIQLKFEADSAQRFRLADYPWELLHDGQKFLAHYQVTISRYIAHEARPPNLPQLEKVNVLLVSSSAFDKRQNLERLTEQEQQAIRKGLEKASQVGHICLQKLDSATFNALRTYLTEHQGQDAPNVLHFDGHGLFGKRCSDPNCRTIHKGVKLEKCDCKRELLEAQGYLLFEDEDGSPHYVSAKELGALLQQSEFGEQSNGITLVVLSACQSAMAVVGDSVFNGTAQNLIGHRIPAVVAMQYSVNIEAATNFAKQFYSCLGQKDPLAVAINKGRVAMGIEDNQWYRPVLYLRWQENEEGQLFAPKKIDSNIRSNFSYESSEKSEFEKEFQGLKPLAKSEYFRPLIAWIQKNKKTEWLAAIENNSRNFSSWEKPTPDEAYRLIHALITSDFPVANLEWEPRRALGNGIARIFKDWDDPDQKVSYLLDKLSEPLLESGYGQILLSIGIAKSGIIQTVEAESKGSIQKFINPDKHRQVAWTIAKDWQSLEQNEVLISLIEYPDEWTKRRLIFSLAQQIIKQEKKLVDELNKRILDIFKKYKQSANDGLKFMELLDIWLRRNYGLDCTDVWGTSKEDLHRENINRFMGSLESKIPNFISDPETLATVLDLRCLDIDLEGSAHNARGRYDTISDSIEQVIKAAGSDINALSNALAAAMSCHDEGIRWAIGNKLPDLYKISPTLFDKLAPMLLNDENDWAVREAVRALDRIRGLDNNQVINLADRTAEYINKKSEDYGWDYVLEISEAFQQLRKRYPYLKARYDISDDGDRISISRKRESN